MSRLLALTLGLAALTALAALLVWDITPRSFPESAHLLLGSAPLAIIAIAYLTHQAHSRPSRGGVLRAVILALAFLCWAENQLLGDGGLATLFNDLAIALFVIDVFLTILGWPSGATTEPELP